CDDVVSLCCVADLYVLVIRGRVVVLFFFCFYDTPPTEIYTLSLTRRSSDLTPSGGAASVAGSSSAAPTSIPAVPAASRSAVPTGDRKSTRLNSSHRTISYAVFCLKKKNYYTTYLLSPIICRNSSSPLCTPNC